MKKLFLNLALFFCLVNFAQTVYKPGYFIDKLGNKKECYVGYNNPFDTPSTFKYKTTLEDKNFETLDINNSTLVVIYDEAKFIGSTVMMDRHSDKINNLEKGKKIMLKEETHFLKLLVEGTFNLYVYNELGLEKFFYSSADSHKIEQLNYKVYYTDGGGLVETDKNEEFKLQLWQNVKCGLPDSKLINRLTYHKENLIDYFVKINSCSKQSGNSTALNTKVEIDNLKDKNNNNVNVTTDKEVEKSKSFKSQSRTVNKEKRDFFNFKLTVLNNFLDPRSVNRPLEFQFEKANSFAITGQVEYAFPFLNNKWSIFIEPNYLTYSQTVPYNNVYQYINQNYQNISLNLSVFELPIGLCYKVYNGNDFKFFTSATLGLINTSNLSNTSTLGTTINIPSNSVGLGFYYKRFELFANLYYGLNNSAKYMNRSTVGVRYTFFTTKKKK